MVAKHIESILRRVTCSKLIPVSRAVGISKRIGGGPAAPSHFGEGKNLKVSTFSTLAPQSEWHLGMGTHDWE